MESKTFVALAKYTLIITEKPDAANRIAMALDVEGKPKKLFDSGVPYFEAQRNGCLVVVPALGHLYTVAGIEKAKRDYPVFEYQWVPRFKAERGASKIRVWLKVIAKLAENAEAFVDACDFDIEGSIIGYTILKYACGGKAEAAKRMKYSTLTKEELQESYMQLLPKLDFALVEAGLARHEVDWLYGINLSRALTTAANKCTGRYLTLSTGRVQGPTLNFLREREEAIKRFVATPYWTITSKVSSDDTTFDVEYERILESNKEAETIIAACKTKEGQITAVTVKESEQKPPFPFDLGALQSEAYRLFRHAPIRTSNAAQHLYLAALISYPRTSSQKLPPSINYQKILRKLNRIPAYSKQASELLAKPSLNPNEGQKTDSAHPAIYPTGNMPEKPLGTVERNIFDLVVRRFMAVFSESAVCQNIFATVDINGHHFGFTATRTLQEGWLNTYKPYAKIKNDSIPPLTEGKKVIVKRVTLKENFTKQPARYNPRSLLMKMEKEEIGTKATRAGVIQTLFDRKYMEGTDTLAVSDLGRQVTEILSKYCPEIVSSQFTRSLEDQMDQIQIGNQTKQAVVQKAVEILKPVTTALKANEADISQQLSQSIEQASLEERTVGTCSKCVDGKLVILRSKKTGKRFVGCTNYFKSKCNVAFPLPQNGLIKPLRSICKNCGSPMVKVLAKGKHPWKLCLNPECPTKGTKDKGTKKDA